MEPKKITAMVDGIEIELTAEQVEEWCRKKREQENPFERKIREKFYYITPNFSLLAVPDLGYDNEKIKYDVANYCSDKDLMQQRAYWLKLEQFLWRESWLKNRGKQPEDSSVVYSIVFIRNRKEWITGSMFENLDGFCPVFIREEDALNAIETIVKPFCKEHPDFRP